MVTGALFSLVSDLSVFSLMFLPLMVSYYSEKSARWLFLMVCLFTAFTSYFFPIYVFPWISSSVRQWLMYVIFWCGNISCATGDVLLQWCVIDDVLLQWCVAVTAVMCYWQCITAVICHSPLTGWRSLEVGRLPNPWDKHPVDRSGRKE